MNTTPSHHKLTVRLINHKPFRNALLVLAICATVLGVLIVPVEANVSNARIHSVEDGLWWAVTTVTGVGYGDMYPVTTLGRVIGSLLQISGVVVFGLIIGIIGITMSKRQEEYYWFRLFDRIDQLESKLSSLEKQNSFFAKKEEEKKE